MSEDRSEILNATVLPVGGVRIGAGTVRLEVLSGSREIGAGNAAYFTPDPDCRRPRRRGLRRSRSSRRCGRTARASHGADLLSSSVVATDAGLLLQVRADSVPLRKLLETTTGEFVAGAGDVRVTGNLAYPVQSSDESIVAAIGNQLGLADHRGATGRQRQNRSPRASQDPAGLGTRCQARILGAEISCGRAVVQLPQPSRPHGCFTRCGPKTSTCRSFQPKTAGCRSRWKRQRWSRSR